MGSLLNKLRMLDAEQKRPAHIPEKESVKPEPYHHVSSIFPMSLFTELKYATASVLESAFGFSLETNPLPEEILFLDTETTGLSGGAGTIAFEIGIGYFTSSGFVVEQFLIHDYSEEPAMLNALNAIMQRFSIICTFNGRTFDVPLLNTRFLMNRIPKPNLPEIHADVLYPARRLWKLRLKRCTLGNLEEQLLNVQREDDLPGALVPQTYFQYLKDGCFAPMERILEHNKQDIVSLAQLFFFLCKQVSVPEAIQNGEDLFSLARALEKKGEQEQALRCYKLSSSNGMAYEAGLSMARIEKSRGEYGTAVKLYQSMLNQKPNSVEACEALAKLYEHKLHDIAGALGYTRQALLLLSEPALIQNADTRKLQTDLQHRYVRLRRKLSNEQK